MTAKEWLRTWNRNKLRYQLLTSERERIDNAIIIKTTYFGDEQASGVSSGIEDKYLELISRNKMIDFELEILRIHIKKVEDALNEISKEYPKECDMMIQRYANGKSNKYIQKEFNYSINSVTSKINLAANELEKLLNA